MSRQEVDFLNQLRSTFKVEAAEHLQAIADGLLELDKGLGREEQRNRVETVFRAAHSLKGAARAVDFTEIESLCQSLEDTFADWKRQESAPSPTAFDVAHRALNAITAAMSATHVLTGAPVRRSSNWSNTIPETSVPPSAESFAPEPISGLDRFPSEGTVRVPLSKLDARLVEAEEMLMAKLTAGQRSEDLRELGRRFEAWRKEWAEIEPDARFLRQTMDRAGSDRVSRPENLGLARLLEFIDWNVEHTKLFEGKVTELTRATEQDHHVIGKLVDDLLEDSKRLLLLPFATISAPFPKLVRDLSRDQGKEVELAIRGDEVEIDKRILEEMKDPLIHLIRNCVDHGVETPNRRVELGKSPRATSTLSVSRSNGNKVELFVSDDGAGISAEKVIESAIEHGLVSAEDARSLGVAEVNALVFQTEISTSPIVTRVSGRGLGLAIVREKTEKLGGAVSVESHPGQGTRFRIVLPSMLATFRGILIEAAGRLFIVPTLHVECVGRAKVDEIRTVEARETIVLGDRTVVWVPLADVLELPRPDAKDGTPAGVSYLVLGVGEQRIAFAVDAVLDEQEVLVKRLNKPLSRIRNIAGATLLGSDQVVPILNVTDLLLSARKSEGAMRPAPEATKVEVTKAVLVAEDSITSRMLLRSILESAGYKVKTAVDGMEAFTLMRAEQFDLVVSDVEMPRLDGFDLTEKIRSDKKLAETPVVLVTAMETREDRERGIEVGASAYIVKSSFDQSNLLDAVRRLI
jgi:two-component system chemotaxis sensor kinase CheA